MALTYEPATPEKLRDIGDGWTPPDEAGYRWRSAPWVFEPGKEPVEMPIVGRAARIVLRNRVVLDGGSYSSTEVREHHEPGFIASNFDDYRRRWCWSVYATPQEHKRIKKDLWKATVAEAFALMVLRLTKEAP